MNENDNRNCNCMMNNNYSVYMTNNSMSNNDCEYNNTREEMFEKIK